MLLRLAALNLWRNQRRTLLLAAALVAGLCGVIFAQAFMHGWLQDMVANAVRGLGGHIQCHAAGYRDNPVIGRGLALAADTAAFLDAHPHVRGWAPRVAVDGVVSSPRDAQAVRITGVDPAREARFAAAASAVVAGRFLEEGRPGEIVLGRSLAERLKVGVGRKVVLLSQQLGGDLGSGAFRVAGIFDSGLEELDRRTVYVRRDELAALLGSGATVTELAVRLDDIARTDNVRAELQAHFGARPVEVLGWRELIPAVAEMLDLSQQFMLPFLGVFYVAMAFGVLNTLLIAVGERTYETGVMRAVGMGAGQVVRLVVTESLIVGAAATLLGVAAGCALSAWCARYGLDLGRFQEGMAYFGMSRVIHPSLRAMDVAAAAGAALATSVAAAVWPAVRAARAAIVPAMRTMT